MDLDRFFTRINPLIVVVLRTPVLHWLLSPALLLITVTGRRSGRRYTIPVGYQRHGDRLVVLVSKARRKSWWRNYEERREIDVLLRRRRLSGCAEVVAPERAEFAELIEATFRRMPGICLQFGVTYDRRCGLTHDQIAHLGREAAVVEIFVE